MYHVASTVPEERPFQSRGSRGPRSFRGQYDRVVAMQQQGPKGTCHAVDEGSDATVCGLDVTTLEDFPDIAWPPTTGDKCLYCRQWTKFDD